MRRKQQPDRAIEVAFDEMELATKRAVILAGTILALVHGWHWMWGAR